MSRVAVVGGGLGGIAAALRLAKLGHQVTLLERSSRLGGALGEVREEGFAWDAGPTSTLLPAVLRDLFRKTGRPIERELELAPLDLVREHRFEDGSVLRLRHGRAAQLQEVEGLGPGLGQAWVDHVAAYAEDWEVLRRGYLENPWTPDDLPRDVSARLDSREMLARRLRKAFKDERLRLAAAHPFVAEGHDPRNVPAWAGMTAYVEQRFGAWTFPGGMVELRDALVGRLTTRRVEVVTEAEVGDIVVREGRAVAVQVGAEQVPADVVVCAVDPRRLPALAGLVAKTMPAIPPVVVHVGLEGPLPEQIADVAAPEVVLHGDPLLVLRPGGRAPAGHSALTIHGRGRLAEDMLRALARHRIDLREQVVVRVDRSPREQVEQGGSAMGVLWQGRATVRRRLGPRTPVPGVYAVGAHATPGTGVPFVGLSATLVAAEVGPA